MKIGVIGAGFSGAVVARGIAEFGFEVSVFDSRAHVAGNCHTERDKETGVMVHKYGPHIFHTDNERVWEFVCRFSKMKNYTNRVKAVCNGEVFTLPINLHTINQFYRSNMGPKQARKFIEGIAENIADPKNFEEQGRAMIGNDLYQAFFAGYTMKQWGIDPRELPSSILKRLPLRFDYNDNYFSHKYQGIPESGYTELVSNILDHHRICVNLSSKIEKAMMSNFDYLIYTGPLDEYFNYEYGRLGYRTLDFKSEVHEGDYQGNAVINYPAIDIPYTRISEHKHFAPWENFDKTIIYKEYSRLAEEDDIPYYPIRLAREQDLLTKYLALANSEKSVLFLGRLATYQYLDMDVTIGRALNASDLIVSALKSNSAMPYGIIQ